MKIMLTVTLTKQIEVGYSSEVDFDNEFISSIIANELKDCEMDGWLLANQEWERIP